MDVQPIDTIEIEEFSRCGVSSIISPSNSCIWDSVEQVVVMINNFNVIDASNFVVSLSGMVKSILIVCFQLFHLVTVLYTFSNTINVNSGGTTYMHSSHSLDLDIK